MLQTQNSLIISRRFRGKINIQKPRAPHYQRQLLIDISKPVYGKPEYLLPDIVLCTKNKVERNRVVIDNPFERILAKECLDWFNTSKMVLFLHMNSISMEDKLPIYGNLKKNKIHLRTYGKKIVQMATEGTRYEAVNHLFTSHQNIIFGQPENIVKTLKILRKAPQMVVLGKFIYL